MDVPALTSLERAVLTAPDLVARAASHATDVAEQRWLLRQPRDVRCSFVEQVIDRQGDPNAAERWMLLAPQAVRRSYVADVLDG